MKQKQITSISLWIGFVSGIAYCTIAFFSHDYASLLWEQFRLNGFGPYILINFLVALALAIVTFLLSKLILNKYKTT